MRRSIVGLPVVLMAVAAGAVGACASSSESSGNQQSAATTAASVLPGLGVPSWATSEHRAATAAAAAGLPTSYRLQVHFRLRNVAAAQAELDAISDPDNAAYGQFLSSEQLAVKYGPTSADVARVRAHFEAAGFTVTEAPANNAFLAVTGSRAAVENTFSVRLASFEVNGEARYAPQSAGALPADIAAPLATVIGLSTHGKIQTPRLMQEAQTVSTDASLPSANCSLFFGQFENESLPSYGAYGDAFPTAPCSGYRPAQLRHLYGLDPLVTKGINGKGQRIAITGSLASPTLFADAQTYAANNDADYPITPDNLQVMVGSTTPPVADPNGYGEQSLDVEAVHAMAPGAKILYVGSATEDDSEYLAAFNKIVDGNLATIISNSWLDFEGGAASEINVPAWEQLILSAGLKGIGVYFASGDWADNTALIGYPSPSFPPSSPYVTAVGGTSLASDATGERVFEAPWQVAFASLAAPDAGAATSWAPAPPGTFDPSMSASASSGGGRSGLFAQPGYQKGVVPSAVAAANGSAWRVFPDISMMADTWVQGFRLGHTVGNPAFYTEFYGIGGGTSASCPLLAGTMAVAQQYTGRTFGFANGLLYRAAKKGGVTDAVPMTTRVAMDSSSVYSGYGLQGDLLILDYEGPESPLSSAKGFDTLTGLGYPAGKPFFESLR